MKNQKGVITTELIIIFPFLILLILSLILTFNIFITKAEVKNKLFESAKYIRNLKYIEVYKNLNLKEELTLYPIIKSKIDQKFTQKNRISSFRIDAYNLKGNSDIYIKVKYKVDLFLNLDIKLTEKIILKPFLLGEDILNSIDNNYVDSKIVDNINVWELSNFKRGKYIGDKLENQFGYRHFGIDKIENETLVAITSIDIRKKSYLKERDFYEKLKKEYDEIYKFKSSSKVGLEEYNKKRLDIVIPDVKFNKEQEKAYLRFINKSKIEIKLISFKGEVYD